MDVRQTYEPGVCKYPVAGTLLFLLILVSFVRPVTAQIEQTEQKVSKISMSGNTTFNDLILREIIANRQPTFMERLRFWKREGFEFNETEIRRDAVRLQRFYQRRGFPDVRVEFEVENGKKDWQRNILFRITEGPEIQIVSAELIWADEDPVDALTGEPSFRRAVNRHLLREGRRYELIRHADVEGMFQNIMKNLGYAFSETRVTAAIDSAAYTAAVTIYLDPGPVGYFGTIQIEGHETVREGLVRRESDLKSGEKFSQRKIQRAQQEIFSHHLFRFVTLSIPEQPRDSTVDVFIRVRENPLRSVQFQAGAGTDEIIRGAVSWTHRNPFGNAHRFTAASRASFLEQRVNLDYLLPYVFNTNSSFLISPFAQRLNEKNYLLFKGGASNSFLYQYSQNLAGSIAYEITKNEERLKNRSFVLRDSTQFYNQSALQFSGFYQRSFIERGEGWAVRPFIELSGFFGTGDVQYNKFQIDVRRYINFSRFTQIALRVETGALLSDDLQKLPANVRFYTGGTSSVRGWGRFELGPKRASFDDSGEFEGYIADGGRGVLAFNTEFRQDMNFLINGFGITLFFDGGQIWRTLDEYSTNDLQYGVGGGLHYRSPIGPIRFDVGYKINPTDEDLGIYNGKTYRGSLARFGFHFSIGQAF